MTKLRALSAAGILTLAWAGVAFPQGDEPLEVVDPKTYLDKVQVLNVKVGEDTLGRDGVFGEVKNIGTHVLDKVEITIYALDSSGSRIFEKTYHPVLVTDFGLQKEGPLKPNYSRSFGCRMDDAPASWAKKVEVEVTNVGFADAATPRPTVDPEVQKQAERAAAGCMGCGMLMVVLPIVIFVLDIVLLIWVARDAKARGMDSAVLWMVLVFITSLLGLIIYLFARPKGELIVCAHCSNKRLRVSAKCPHCGNA
jgi:thiol:disulfide interchange protein